MNNYQGKIFVLFFAAFLLFLVCRPVFSVDEVIDNEKPHISIKECVVKALNSNPKLLAKSADVRAAEERHSVAQSAQRPRLKAEETFTKMGEPMKFSVTGFPPMSIGDGELDIRALRLSQPVYTGGKIENGIRATRSEVALRRFGETLQRESLAGQVVDSYIAILTARAFQEVASQALYDTIGHAHLTESMLHYGSLVRNDVLKIQVAVSERRENLIKAENAVKLSCALLSSLIGEEVSPETELTGFSYGSKVIPDEKTARKEAFANHPAILAGRESVRLFRFAAGAAKGDLRPSLALLGNVYSGSQMNEEQSNWDATLYVGFNLFDAGESRAKVREAKAEVQKAQQDLSGLERDIALGIRQAFLQVDEAKARLTVAKEAEIQAKESLRLTEVSFKAGSATSQNLLDAETALVAAESRRITAIFDHLRAETHFFLAAGCLEQILSSIPETEDPHGSQEESSVNDVSVVQESKHE